MNGSRRRGEGFAAAWFLGIAALSVILSVAGHLLPPRAYAPANLLFDYEFGLIRRGLTGELLRPVFGEAATLAELQAASIAVTLTGVAALAVFAVLRLGRGRGAQFAALILLNGFAFRSLIGATGFLDGVLLAIAVAALLAPARGAAGVALRCGAMALGALVHENMLPWFAALFALDLWLARRPGPATAAAALAPAALGAAVAAVLFQATAVNISDAQAFAEHLNARHATGADLGALPTVAHGLEEQARFLAEQRAGHSYTWWLAFDGLPLFLMSLWLVWLVQKALPRSEGAATRLLAAAAILAPLSLNLVAYDVVRFGMMSVVAGFIALATVLAHRPAARARLDAALGPGMFLLVLIVNLHVTTLQINNANTHEGDLPWVFFEHLEWAF